MTTINLATDEKKSCNGVPQRDNDDHLDCRRLPRRWKSPGVPQFSRNHWKITVRVKIKNGLALIYARQFFTPPRIESSRRWPPLFISSIFQYFINRFLFTLVEGDQTFEIKLTLGTSGWPNTSSRSFCRCSLITLASRARVQQVSWFMRVAVLFFVVVPFPKPNKYVHGGELQNHFISFFWWP